MRTGVRTLTILLVSTAFILGFFCLRFPRKDDRQVLTKSLAVARFGLLGHGRDGLPQSQQAAKPMHLFDPVLTYSTFLGPPASSGSYSSANVIFVDGPGNTYVAGTGAVQTTAGVVQSNQCQDCPSFLSKLDPTGQTLLFSTLIEGISVTAMAVDTEGNIYVAGQVPWNVSVPGTPSYPILPIPAGSTPLQAAPKGRNLGILKLNSTASILLAATYLGGSGTEQVGGLAADSTGNLYITGNTTSNDFPTSQNVLQPSLGTSGTNVFVTKLEPTLSVAVYSTYLGQNSIPIVGFGSGSNPISDNQGGHRAIAIDAFGNAYVAGNASTGFPTTPGAVQGTCSFGIDAGASCAFVAQLNPDASSLLYSTYLGGTSGASAQAVAVQVDASQNIYVGGTTTSGYPEVNSLQSCSSSSNYGFVSEISSSGALVFSTCFAQNASIQDLVIDPSGYVYVVGSSSGNVVLKNPIQINPSIYTGAFVASINPNIQPPSLIFSSFIGSGNEGVSFGGVGVDSGGNIYQAGTVYDQSALTFPVFNALQPWVPFVQNSGYPTTAFIMKISPTDAAAAAVSPGAVVFAAQQVGTSSSPQAVTVFDLGSAALTVSNAAINGDFSSQNNCGTVSPAGGTCAIQVTFTPTVTGTRSGTLTITDDSAGSPHMVALTGQGALPTLTVAPDNLSFGSQAVNTTSPMQSVTLTNPGQLSIQISHVQASGDFSETNGCPTALAPSASCTVTLTFTPTAPGARTGTLTLTDSATDSPQTISLAGTGSTGFVMAAGMSSASVSPGATATYNLTATAAAGFSGNVSFTCTGAPPSSTCSISPNSLALTALGTQPLSVAVATMAGSATYMGKNKNVLASSGLTNLALLFGSLTLAMLVLSSERRASIDRRKVSLIIALLMLSTATLGCGGGGSSSKVTGTPSGTYTLMITGTSGTITQTTTLNLTVQ